MEKQLSCEVIASGGKFMVEYKSFSERANDAYNPINVIKKVMVLNDYELSLGQLRERTIWQELTAAVLNNSLNYWEGYWKDKQAQRNGNVHPVFDEILSNIIN